MAASYDLPRLLDLLVKTFSLEELHTLAFDLGVDYESLGEPGRKPGPGSFSCTLTAGDLSPSSSMRSANSGPRCPGTMRTACRTSSEPPPASDPRPGAPSKEPVGTTSSPPKPAVPTAAVEAAGGPTVFISYSHKDEAWKDRLVTQLGVLQRQGLLDLWDDRRIGAGEDWHGEIRAAMGRATVAVLLISADFLTSQFILGEEVPALLQRRDTEGVHIYPIIVRPCAWKAVKWLSRIQVRPKDGRALSGGTDYQIDADLAAVAEEIAALMGAA